MLFRKCPATGAWFFKRFHIHPFFVDVKDKDFPQISQQLDLPTSPAPFSLRATDFRAFIRSVGGQIRRKCANACRKYLR